MPFAWLHGLRHRRQDGAHAPSRLAGQCLVCRSWQAQRLCGDCVARFAAAVARCGQCGLHVPAPVPHCGDCIRHPPPFDRTRVAVDYGFPWDGLILGLKHHARLEVAPALAGLLTQAVAVPGDADAGQARVDVVVPVPLSHERLRERGHNQAWELARRVAAALNLPAQADALERLHDTRAQQSLDRAQRLANLAGQFTLSANGRRAVTGRRVALVDDVMTTGATAREAAATLLRGGAANVEVWAMARTPRQ